MRAIIDGDLLAHECAFGADISWKTITGEETTPPFSHVEKLLTERIEFIMRHANADDATIYLTEGKTFRFDVAKTKPYKGNRKNPKPFHHKNIVAYLKGQYGAKSIPNLEADDSMAIDHVNNENTILCSRDKDLMSIPGMFYRWELGKGSSWGPDMISKDGWVKLDRDRKPPPKITGCGLSWFYAQLLMGDAVDNIGGCRNAGPVKAYELLAEKNPDEQLAAVKEEYKNTYGDEWEKIMLENGQLCWIVRRLNQDGSPEVYQIGMTE